MQPKKPEILSAPRNIIIYRFDYHAEIKKHHNEQDEAKDGRTIVYDAEGHKTVYSYDRNHRIKKIVKFSGTTKNDYSQYSFESFIWGDRKDDCNLKTKFLADAQTEKVHHGYHFKYDNQGNTKVKTLFGKLTGRKPTDIKLNKNDKPIDDGYEQENTTYTYSKMLNLIRSETNSDGKKIEYK